MKKITEFTVTAEFPEMVTGIDFIDQLKENWKAMNKQDADAKKAGTLIGRYISEPFADGHAYYVVVSVGKRTCKLSSVTGMGDDWVIPNMGPTPTVKISYVKQALESREGLAKLFGKVAITP